MRPGVFEELLRLPPNGTTRIAFMAKVLGVDVVTIQGKKKRRCRMCEDRGLPCEEKEREGNHPVWDTRKLQNAAITNEAKRIGMDRDEFVEALIREHGRLPSLNHQHRKAKKKGP